MSDKLLRDILAARSINEALGGALVGSWDIDQLDDPTVEAYLMLRSGLGARQAASLRIEQAKSKFREQILGKNRAARRH